MTDENQDAESPWNDEDIVEIYAAGSSVEADRIVLILDEENVEAQRREGSVPALPSISNARHFITVLAHDKDKAISVIKKAIEDEIIVPDGAFL